MSTFTEQYIETQRRTGQSPEGQAAENKVRGNGDSSYLRDFLGQWNVTMLAYNNSIQGLSYQIAQGEQAFDLRDWEPSMLEDIGATVLSFMMPVDFLTFAATSGVGGLVARGVMKRSVALATKKLIGQGLSEAAAKSAISKGTSKLLTGMERFATSPASSRFITGGIGLGGYTFRQDLKAQKAYTGEVDFSEALLVAAKAGLAAGGAGVVGGKVAAGLSRKSLLKRTLEQRKAGDLLVRPPSFGERGFQSLGEFAPEVLAFGTIGPVLEGEIPTLEGYAHATGVMLGMKGVSIIKGKGLKAGNAIVDELYFKKKRVKDISEDIRAEEMFERDIRLMFDEKAAPDQTLSFVIERERARAGEQGTKFSKWVEDKFDVANDEGAKNRFAVELEDGAAIIKAFKGRNLEDVSRQVVGSFVKGLSAEGQAEVVKHIREGKRASGEITKREGARFSRAFIQWIKDGTVLRGKTGESTEPPSESNREFRNVMAVYGKSLMESKLAIDSSGGAGIKFSRELSDTMEEMFRKSRETDYIPQIVDNRGLRRVKEYILSVFAPFRNLEEADSFLMAGNKFEGDITRIHRLTDKMVLSFRNHSDIDKHMAYSALTREPVSIPISYLERPPQWKSKATPIFSKKAADTERRLNREDISILTVELAGMEKLSLSKDIITEQKRKIERAVRSEEYTQFTATYENLPPDLRRTTEKAARLLRTAGKKLVRLGILGKEGFEKLEGKYLPRVYLEYLLSDGPGLGGRVSLGLQYIRARRLVSFEQQQELGIIQDISKVFQIGMLREWGDIFKISYMNKIMDNPVWVLQTSVVHIDGVTMGVKKAQDVLGRVRDSIRVADKSQMAALRDKESKYEDALTKLSQSEGVELEGFTKMPDRPEYGPLRGALVKKEIADQILARFEVTDPSEYKEMFRRINNFEKNMTALWKAAKVPFNPPTIMRNIISNPLQLNMSGMTLDRVLATMIRAARLMKGGAPQFVMAQRKGAFRGDMGQAEIEAVFKATKALSEVTTINTRPLQALYKLGTAIGRQYGKIDQFYKFVKYLDATERLGMSPEKAVLEAHKWVMDYSRVSPTVRHLREHLLGIPFITYQSKILPLLLETMKNRPWIFAKYIAAPMIMTSASLLDQDISDGDWDSMKRSLSRRVRDGVYALIPGRDEKGRMTLINLEYFFPWGNWIEVTKNLREMEGFEALSNMGQNPALLLVAAFMTGVEPGTGREIYSPLDTPAQKALSSMEFLWNLATPGWMASYGAGAKTIKMIGVPEWMPQWLQTTFATKVTDIELTPSQAAVRWLGANVNPIDIGRGTFKQYKIYQARLKEVEMAYSRQVKSLYLVKGGVDVRKVQQLQERYVKAVTDLAEEFMEPNNLFVERMKRELKIGKLF